MTQRANGIMGMALHTETLVPRLKAAGLVEREAFSLCLAADGGTLTLGGASPHLHAEPMQCVCSACWAQSLRVCKR